MYSLHFTWFLATIYNDGQRLTTNSNQTSVARLSIQMFVDPASSPLCHNNRGDTVQVFDETSEKLHVKNNDDELHSTVNTTVLPGQHYSDESASSTTNYGKFLCILLSIVVFLIVAVGTILWIMYSTSVRSQPFHTETSTDSFSGIHTQMSSTATLLATTSLYKDTSGNRRIVDVVMRVSEFTKNDLLVLKTSKRKLALYIGVEDFLHSHRTTEASIQQLVKKVLFIVADGIPADVIENVPVINIKHIQDIGTYTRAYVGGDKGNYTQTPTISSPGYMSLLTGTWGNKHNVYDNYVKNPNYHYKNIFRLVKEQQPEKRIGIFSTWTTNRVKLIGEGLLKAGNITFDYKFDGYELDRIAYPHDKQGVYIYNIDHRVTNETSKCIRTHAPDLSWVYLQHTDDIGHFFGDSEQFNQSIIYLDEQIGRIWEAIDYRMQYHDEDWLVIITTDHGRDPKKGKHHAGQSVRERTTWIVTNSQETNTYFHHFQPGIVDILPTIARFMNVTIPMDSERELDGIPLIGIVSLIEPHLSLNGDQLNISWTVLHNAGNVTIWLSTSNSFKKGMADSYTLIDIVPIEQKMVMINVKKYSSQFYKLVLEGQHNTVNKWVYRPRRQNRI